MMPLAIVMALGGSFLVASQLQRRRLWGFVAFTLANILWISRGVMTQDPWIIIQFVAFLVASVTGMAKNRKKSE